jgi:thioesterase domain-containing protein/acyl carrier protein
MVPSAFVTMESLPLTPNGKVDRKALAPPSLSTTNHVALRIQPRNSFEAQLTLIWEEILGVRPIGINDNFFALGGHSILAAHMFVEIEKRFDRTLSPGTILTAPTIEMLASVLAQDRMCVLSRSLVPLRPTGSQPPFFCVHGRGGNVISLRDLAMNMSPDRPFYCLQARGLDGTEPLLTIEEMAAEYIREIKSAQPQGPYFIGGASFGGIVAFEMARQLESRGERVALLALLDTYNEAFGKSLPATLRALYHARYLFERSRLRLRESLPQEHEDSFYLFKIPPMLGRILINAVLRTARKGNKTSDSVSTVLDRIPKLNIEAAKNYFPQSYSGNITLFKAKTRVAEPYHDPFLGWGKLALGGLDVEEVPGTHTSCLREPDVRVLAEKLETKLRVAGAGDSNAVPWSRPYPR